MLRRLTDNYNKEDSNISKLYTLIEEVAESIEWNKMRLWRGVNLAEGKTLDLIGANVNQPRGKANDTIYKALIRAAILRNKSNSTLSDIIELLSFMLQVDPEDLRILEGYDLDNTWGAYAEDTWNDLLALTWGEVNSLPEKPAYILIRQVRPQELADIGLTSRQLEKIIKTAAAAGVTVEVEFLYNTWGAVNQYSWEEIEQLTWENVLDVELEGTILPI